MNEPRGVTSSSSSGHSEGAKNIPQPSGAKSGDHAQDLAPAAYPQQGAFSMDSSQFTQNQYFNPYQSINSNPDQFMQYQMQQMQYQMHLQQMQQQMQQGGVIPQGADVMAVHNLSGNPYGGVIQNPYYNFNFAMPMQGAMSMQGGMPMPGAMSMQGAMPMQGMQMPMPGAMSMQGAMPMQGMQMPMQGMQMPSMLPANSSSQQLDGGFSSSSAAAADVSFASGEGLVKIEGQSNFNANLMPQPVPQSFDPTSAYAFYPYMPPVNPYMYMGNMGMGMSGTMGDVSFDHFKGGKYPGMNMAMGGMNSFGGVTYPTPSPAGMNPKPQPAGSSSSHTIAQVNIDKLSSAEVETANSSVLVISWITILEEFDKRYDVVFESCSAKIHLDTSKTIIDGAKGRWRHVTLLDTLIAYGLGRERSKEDCERRRFNQYLALQEAVCFACAEALIWHSTELFSKGDSGTSSTTNPYMCTVTDIPQAWSTTENLKMDLLHHSSKSWKKRKDAVEILCKQWLVLEIGLHILITSVVNRIYNQHFVNPCCRANRNRSNRDLVEETDAALFDFCQSVTLELSDLEKSKLQQEDSKLKRKR